MKIIKDLLYTKNNQSLDISRLSVFLSVLAFWGSVFTHQYQKQEFDPVAIGTGIAAIFAGGAGWIYARQKYEKEGEGNGPTD